MVVICALYQVGSTRLTLKSLPGHAQVTHGMVGADGRAVCRFAQDRRPIKLAAEK